MTVVVIDFFIGRGQRLVILLKKDTILYMYCLVRNGFQEVMEGNAIVNGMEQIDLETCWDDPFYDTLGHHRVVNLFKFTYDSSFTVSDANERQWKGDPYQYFKGPVEFKYDAGSRALQHTSNNKIQNRDNICYNGKGFIIPNGMTGFNTINIYSVSGRLLFSELLDSEKQKVLVSKSLPKGKFVAEFMVGSFSTTMNYNLKVTLYTLCIKVKKPQQYYNRNLHFS